LICSADVSLERSLKSVTPPPSPGEKFISAVISGCRGVLGHAFEAHGILLPWRSRVRDRRQNGAFQYLHRQGILNEALNGPPSGARRMRIEALVRAHSMLDASIESNLGVPQATFRRF